MKRYILFFFTTIAVLSIDAVRTNVGGLNYTLIKESHEAIINYGNKCIGELDIPSEVNYNGETFVVKSMIWKAFYDSPELTKVRIPKTLESVMHYYPNDPDEGDIETILVSSDVMNPFSKCYSLESIEVDEENPSMKSVDGVLISKDGTRLYCYPIGKQQEAYSIPEDVEWIGANAFEGSHNLTTLTIPNNITHICSCAFQNCNNLTDLYCYAENVPTTGVNVFNESPIASATLHVPAGSIEEYKTTSPWSNFGNIVALPIEINETTFPDENFRNWVLAQSYGQDGMLTEEEIVRIKEINVISKSIKSLKGIEFFTELTNLDCSWNQLPLLDVSKNTALKELNCQGNQLTELNLLKNIELEDLACNYNQLTSLDVSQNSALAILACIENQLTELDLSRNNLLKRLVCPYNQLTSINVSGCTALESFRCAGNKLAELDVSGCPALEDLICMSNQIKGEAMDALVESLPTVNRGHWGVINHTNEQNVMTKLQVAVAKAKGWYVQYNDSNNQWKNYEGSDEPTSVVADGQLFKPLGLGIETPNDWVIDFQPQMYVEGNILYVCTKQGLYSKDLSKDESEWQLVGFEGIPILDYVRRGEDIFALCFNDQKDIFLLSHDSGQTYEDVTPDDFRSFINREGHTFWYFNQHPTDPDAFLLTSYHGPGMFMTTDFGQTWEKLADYTPDYMGFHPLTPEIIYECGGGGFTDEKTDLRISYDGGQTWQDKTSCFPDYGILYRMAFHPTDPDKWIVGGKRCLYTTDDGGKTWDTQSLNGDGSTSDYNDYSIDWRYAAYDNEDADIIYMAGGHQTQHMKLICSTDGGKTWNRPYLEPIKTSPTEYVFDMKQYGDKLLIYSQSDVYMVSKADLIAQTTPVTFTAGQIATIILPTAPDASKGKYYRLDRYEDGQIIFEQELQPQAHIPYIIVPNEDFSINPRTLDLTGLSRDTVSIAGISFIGSYVSETFDYQEDAYIDFIDITPDCRFDESCVIGALRAYLLVRWDDPYNQGGTRVPPLNKRGIVLRDYETGISMPSVSNKKNTLFDLQGREIDKITQPGIYIGNGQKILIK